MDLPHYGTTDGFIKAQNIVTSPVLMWVEALDMALQVLSKCVDLSKVGKVKKSSLWHFPEIASM